MGVVLSHFANDSDQHPHKKRNRYGTLLIPYSTNCMLDFTQKRLGGGSDDGASVWRTRFSISTSFLRNGGGGSRGCQPTWSRTSQRVNESEHKRAENLCEYAH